MLQETMGNPSNSQGLMQFSCAKADFVIMAAMILIVWPAFQAACEQNGIPSPPTPLKKSVVRILRSLDSGQGLSCNVQKDTQLCVYILLLGLLALAVNFCWKSTQMAPLNLMMLCLQNQTVTSKELAEEYIQIGCSQSNQMNQKHKRGTYLLTDQN